MKNKILICLLCTIIIFNTTLKKSDAFVPALALAVPMATETVASLLTIAVGMGVIFDSPKDMEVFIYNSAKHVDFLSINEEIKKAYNSTTTSSINLTKTLKSKISKLVDNVSTRSGQSIYFDDYSALPVTTYYSPNNKHLYGQGVNVLPYSTNVFETVHPVTKKRLKIENVTTGYGNRPKVYYYVDDILVQSINGVGSTSYLVNKVYYLTLSAVYDVNAKRHYIGLAGANMDLQTGVIDSSHYQLNPPEDFKLPYEVEWESLGVGTYSGNYPRSTDYVNTFPSDSLSIPTNLDKLVGATSTDVLNPTYDTWASGKAISSPTTQTGLIDYVGTDASNPPLVENPPVDTGIGWIDSLIQAIENLFIKLFVPSPDYISNKFNNIKDKFGDKLGVVGLAKLEELSKLEDDQFNSFYVEGLMGTGRAKIIDADTINAFVLTMRSWVSGLMAILLILFNYNKVYFLVRGVYPMSNGFAFGWLNGDGVESASEKRKGKR